MSAAHWLAFDTSTDVLSLGLSARGQTTLRTLAGGAQASAQLIPQVLDLLAQASLGLADLQAIVFGRGPGSFTGLRTACAVAQGLAFGANVPVLPIDTLLAVAEDARLRSAGLHLVDAPLGGTPREAAAGTLSAMVGADDAVFARVQPVIACWAATINHLGAVGLGHKIKLLNNFLSATALAAT